MTPKAKEPEHPVFTFASPRGRPDSLISESEARMWLLTTLQRKSGWRVVFDSESERWVPSAPPAKMFERLKERNKGPEAK